MKTSIYMLSVLCLLCIGWALWSSMKMKDLRDQIHTLELELAHAQESNHSGTPPGPTSYTPEAMEKSDELRKAFDSAKNDRFELMSELMSRNAGRPYDGRISNLLEAASTRLEEGGTLDEDLTKDLLKHLSPAEQRLVARLAEQVLTEPTQNPTSPTTGTPPPAL